MSTRSSIAIQNDDGSVTSIYCHFDGYPKGVGKMLQEYYMSPAKVKELIALGDISSLGSEIGEKHDFDKCPEGETNAYGRDREEEDTEALTYQNRKEWITERKEYCCEYFYLFKNGKWERYK